MNGNFERIKIDKTDTKGKKTINSESLEQRTRKKEVKKQERI